MALPLILGLLAVGTALAAASSGGGGGVPAKKVTLVPVIEQTPAQVRWTALASSQASKLVYVRAHPSGGQLTLQAPTPPGGPPPRPVTLNTPAWSAPPPPNAQPADITAWCEEYGISPVFAYPMFGWSFNGDVASAGYDLGNNDHVNWTAKSDGTFSYVHTYPSGITKALDSIAQALAIVGDLTGFVFVGMFLHTAQAIANHEPISELGAALKADWDMTSNAAQLAFNVLDGDWKAAWNHATNYGKDLTGIIAAFGGTAPDIDGKLTIKG